MISSDGFKPNDLIASGGIAPIYGFKIIDRSWITMKTMIFLLLSYGMVRYKPRGFCRDLVVSLVTSERADAREQMQHGRGQRAKGRGQKEEGQTAEGRWKMAASRW